MTQNKPCPICKKPAVEEFMPFCSKHCKNIDLNRWLSGVYIIPGESLPVEEEGEFSEEAE
jgi:endogenous inhibitor of DNA gyrase (YacG/DUF329 family)